MIDTALTAAPFAAAYDAVQGDLGDATKRKFVFPRLASRIAGAKRALEIGCGNGAFGRYCWVHHQLAVDGLDIDEQLIDLGRRRDARFGVERRLSAADFEIAASRINFAVYDAIVFPFSLQDIAHPRAALGALAERLGFKTVVVMINESYAAMTSPLFPHSIPRKLHPVQGFDGARKTSIATWDLDATGTSYCRPDPVYLEMFRAAGLICSSSGYFGLSPSSLLAGLQSVIPPLRRFNEASFEVKNVLRDG